VVGRHWNKTKLTMSSPYSVADMHRDFVVLIALGLLPLAAVMGYFRPLPPSAPSCALILVEGMCCEITAQPAIEELSHVSGVISIAPRYRDSAIHVALAGDRPPSANSLWEAVEKSHLRPLQLVMEDRTFNSRPVE